jgi:Pentapeptide repeats (8 copies)
MNTIVPSPTARPSPPTHHLAPAADDAIRLLLGQVAVQSPLTSRLTVHPSDAQAPGANPSGAKMSKANLSGANLASANLFGANLTSACVHSGGGFSSAPGPASSDP